MKYKQTKCIICNKFDILKNDICIECDGGDDFVNELYKYLRRLRIKDLYDTNQERLLSSIQAYEKHDWIMLSSIKYQHHQVDGWCFGVTMAREK